MNRMKYWWVEDGVTIGALLVAIALTMPAVYVGMVALGFSPWICFVHPILCSYLLFAAGARIGRRMGPP